MSITGDKLYPPQPKTSRGKSVHLSYDKINDRIAYANGKAIIVRPLNPESSSPVIHFTKHVYGTTVASFSPSGNYIASGDESGNVKIWDTSVVASAEGEATFEQPIVKSEFQILSGPIRAIAWDADNARIIAVGQGKEKSGHCFSWDSGNSIGEIQGHSSGINDVDIKPQRPYRAATVGDDNSLVFFTGPPFKFDKSSRGQHSNTVRAVRFSPDGKWLVSVGADRNIVVYDGKTGEFIKKQENSHDGGIFALYWSSDSKHFFTASADNSIKKWDIDTLEAVEVFVAGSGDVENQQVGLIVSDKYIVSLSLNGFLNYFTSGTSKPVKVIEGHQTSITVSDYSESTLTTGASDGSLYVWKAKDTALEPTPSPVGAKDVHSNYVVSIARTPKHIITTAWDDTLKYWAAESTQTATLKQQPKQVAVDGDKTFVLFESSVSVFNGTELAQEENLGFEAETFALNPIKKVLVVAKKDKYEVVEFALEPSFKLSRTYPTSVSPPSLIRISPDGKYTVVADKSGKYILYDSDSLSTVTTRWSFHSSKVCDAQWSTDSKFLASVGLDCGVFIFSVARQTKVLKFPLAHQGGVTSVKWKEYDPEQKSARLITTGLDGVVKTWNVDLSAY